MGLSPRIGMPPRERCARRPKGWGGGRASAAEAGDVDGLDALALAEVQVAIHHRFPVLDGQHRAFGRHQVPVTLHDVQRDDLVLADQDEVVEATARPTPPAADRGKRPMADPEATAESPIHPQDADLPIPPQEVSSAYVSLLFFVLIFQ